MLHTNVSKVNSFTILSISNDKQNSGIIKGTGHEKKSHLNIKS